MESTREPPREMTAAEKVRHEWITRAMHQQARLVLQIRKHCRERKPKKDDER